MTSRESLSDRVALIGEHYHAARAALSQHVRAGAAIVGFLTLSPTARKDDIYSQLDPNASAWITEGRPFGEHAVKRREFSPPTLTLIGESYDFGNDVAIPYDVQRILVAEENLKKQDFYSGEYIDGPYFS